MEVIKVGKVQEFKSAAVVKKTVSSKEQLLANFFFVDAGGAVPLHRHADAEEVFYIIEGGGTFSVGEENHKVEAGDLIHVPQNQWHGVKNDTGLKLTFLGAIRIGAKYEAKA